MDCMFGAHMLQEFNHMTEKLCPVICETNYFLNKKEEEEKILI